MLWFGSSPVAIAVGSTMSRRPGPMRDMPEATLATGGRVTIRKGNRRRESITKSARTGATGTTASAVSLSTVEWWPFVERRVQSTRLDTYYEFDAVA